MNLTWAALPVAPALLGESPFWHPDEGALYWCDIPGKALHRWHAASGAHRGWSFDVEPGCCAPVPGGTLIVAFRDGLFHFDPASGERTRLAKPPYDTASERFNDGKADPQGRFWAGTMSEERGVAKAALYRWGADGLKRMAGDISTSNGLAFSPDGRTLYWSDTPSHSVMAYDFDPVQGTMGAARVFATFEPKQPGQGLAGYGGRPDGAAVDIEGAYWCAMYEGQRLVRFAADGRVLQSIDLPVRCPTMPCFGGPDLRTLYVTTASKGRPAEELAAQPLAGCVLHTRVDVPGLPVNFARP
jgi:sugar lactone lactonase YvrE